MGCPTPLTISNICLQAEFFQRCPNVWNNVRSLNWIVDGQLFFHPIVTRACHDQLPIAYQHVHLWEGMKPSMLIAVDYGHDALIARIQTGQLMDIGDMVTRGSTDRLQLYVQNVVNCAQSEGMKVVYTN